MKFFSYWLLLAFCLTTSMSVSQNDIYQAIKKLPLTDAQKMTKIDSLLDKNLADGNLSDLEIVSRKYSNWLFKKGNYKEAVNSLEKSIKYHSGDSASLQKKMYNAGYFSFKAKNYPQSIDFYKKTVALDNTNSRAASAYIELGRCYNFLGDLYLSIQYFETAEELLTNLKNYEELCRGFINSFNSYRDLKTAKSLDRLFRNLSIADSLIVVKPLRLQTKFNIKRSLGKYYYINKQQVDTINGLKAFQEALEFAREANDSLGIAAMYGEMGILFNYDNLKRSTRYFNEALKYNPDGSKPDLAVIYSNIGRNQAKEGKFESALDYQNKALQIVLNDTIDLDGMSPADRGNLWKENNTQENLWEISSYLAETYLLQYEETKNTEALDKAISYFRTTDEIFDAFTQNVSEFNSKLQWRKNATESYGRALKACYYAQDTESAFFFMEKNKALLLTEAIDKQRTNRSFNLPSNVYQLEKELKNKIGELEQTLETNGSNVAISEEILRKKERLNSYWDSISNIYQDYVPLRNSRILDIAEVQSSLGPDEIVISYHLAVDEGTGIYTNTDNGYVIAITTDKIYLDEIPNLPGLKKDVKALTNSLKSPFTTEDSARFYYALSNKLYRALFPSEEIKNAIKGRKVAIVADNYLSLLPFEALSTKADAPAYLIYDSEIHYLYSNSFLENNRKTELAENSFLGIAPTSFDQLKLPLLTFSPLEIDNLGNYYSGDSFVNDLATKDTFLQKLPHHGIIHLATHADAQDSLQPWIAFHDGKITLEDLYQTQNNASLVVLSGCNTTIGEQKTGEGVMSLARGFFYSGAQSVMSTLWSIDDKSTATITGDFYKNLANGQSKSEALHNAKLNYLNTNSLSDSSPYFWASFIMLGENGTLESDTPIWPYLSVLAIGLFTILIIRKRRKRSKTS